MQTAGIFVRALAELPASVQIRQHQLNGGDFEFWMNIDWNSAAIIADGAGAIDVNSHFDVLTVASQMLVDRIVEHLKNAVVQPALIGVADVHAGPFANSFETFQFIDF